MSVLEPWNTEDPECEERGGDLGELSDQALRITRRASRPSFLGVTGPTGLNTLEDFDDALPRAAMKAKYAFEGRTRAEPEDPPPPRPNLRDAFRRGPGAAPFGRDAPFGQDGSGPDDHPDRDDGDDPDDGMAPLGGRPR